MPFAKGNNANPRGRPKKGSAITDFIRHQASMPADEEGRRTKAEALAQALFQAAIGGDIAAAKAIMDRLDGSVKQQQEITGKDGGPVLLRWADAARDE